MRSSDGSCPISNVLVTYVGGLFWDGRANSLSDQAKGLELFNGKANCAACHPSTVMGTEPGPLFTDFTYDNVGIPKNDKNPFLNLPKDLNLDGTGFVDHGLATTIAGIDPARAKAQDGKFKVPTLRNIDLTAPYSHNGFFPTLKEIVHFYNARDLNNSPWPAAEIPGTVNHDELGDLQLSGDDEDAIIAFLKTLTDGYRSPPNQTSRGAESSHFLPRSSLGMRAVLLPH